MKRQAGGTLRAFRAHFAQHNRQVLALTGLTLAAALLLWLAAYIVIYWLTLVVISAGEGISARVPPSFLPVFALCAAVLCLLGWAAQRIWPEYFPRDKKSPFEILLDIILAIPRVTLAVWGNLSAYQSLNDREMKVARELLQTIGRVGKLEIQTLPVEIPDPELRTKIVFALQVAGLIELRKNREGMWLALRGKKGRFLSQSAVKIEPGRST